MTPEVAALVGELRRLMAKATPGPWTMGKAAGAAQAIALSASGAAMLAKVYGRPVSTNDGTRVITADEQRASAALIIAAVNALPALLDAVEAGERRTQDAERLADEVAALVRRRIIDARSPAGDALLDFRDPPSPPRADRLATLEADLDAARALARRLVTCLKEAAWTATDGLCWCRSSADDHDDEPQCNAVRALLADPAVAALGLPHGGEGARATDRTEA